MGTEVLEGILITPALGGTFLGDNGAGFIAGGGGLLGGSCLGVFGTSGIPKPEQTFKQIILAYIYIR